MLVVISPAKRLDWSEVPEVSPTAPAFPEDAARLAKAAGRLTRPELQKLMGLSADLAKLNKARFAAFEAEPGPERVRPAARAFAGDTYAGLDARSLDDDALSWAQEHLRILSGLYGLLRPRDAIQPYRLEMGSKLKTRKGGDLYAYWGDRLGRALDDQARATGATALVNCASQEYFGAVATGALSTPVVTPVFMEERPEGPKIVSFYAKKARGAMARFIVERRLTDPASLVDFDSGGYRHAPDLSEPGRPVFLRSEAAARDAA
ncbi:MAG: peroxide stress protein YaaA [Deinococcus-Thermus bacterium]|jgi:cytoplasmic iron level regulating protein YaaA (DUF328/UPF0246 family)|nr:peroxide stress protein YaaA [Deinococcota bacterium]